MPNWKERNEEGMPCVARVATDGSHVLIYVNSPALTMVTHGFRYCRPIYQDGVPCLRFELIHKAATDEAIEATRIATEECNAQN